MLSFACSQTQGRQLIERGRELDFPHVRGARRGGSRSHIPAHAVNRCATRKVTDQGKRRQPEQRKLALPQRQTAFRQTPPTVITTLLTVGAVNPNTGPVRSPSAPLLPCTFISPFPILLTHKLSCFPSLRLRTDTPASSMCVSLL